MDIVRHWAFMETTFVIFLRTLTKGCCAVDRISIAYSLGETVGIIDVIVWEVLTLTLIYE
jgi:hypothetical protein